MSPDSKKLVEHLHFVHGYAGRKIASMLSLPKSTVNDYLFRLKQEKFELPPGAKVLIFDIETAPGIGYFWRRFKENISQAQVIQEPFMLTWSAKWFGADEIMSDSIAFHTKDIKPDNDRPIIDSLWTLLDDADILVAHNGDRFDEPVFNARALYHGKTPPHPSKMVDTLKIAKSRFRFPSNKLGDLALYLGIEEKMEHSGMPLWSGFLEGDEDCQHHMLDYNIQDTVVLEAVYAKLRSWDKRHPNVALMDGTLGTKQCGVCGSHDMSRTGKFAYTGVSKFPTHRCNGCGAIKRDRKSILSKEDREDILMNV